MLTKDDLKAIDSLLDKRTQPINKSLKNHTGKLMEIEQNIGAVLELRQDVSEIRTTVKDHEERISQLETL